MAFQLATQKQLRMGVYLFFGVALLLWIASVFMPTPDQLTESHNGHVVAVIQNTDPRFPHEMMLFRLDIAFFGVIFALFAGLCYWLSRRPSGI